MNNNVDYTVKEIPMKEIFADPNFNCRGYIVPLDVTELAESIKSQGLQSPIILEHYDKVPGKKYRIVAGHRRHKAFMVNEAKTIPAFVRDDLDEIDARVLNLTENISRKNLSLYEEAMALKSLFDLGLSETEVRNKISASRGWVQVRYMLLKLPEEIREEVKKENISQQAVRDLYTIKTNGGSLNDMYDFVKLHKKHKLEGKSVTVRSQNKKKTTKRKREIPEIFELQDVIRETFGNGLTTRALAWVAGEISNEEMHNTLLITAEKLDKDVRYGNTKLFDFERGLDQTVT